MEKTYFKNWRPMFVKTGEEIQPELIKKESELVILNNDDCYSAAYWQSEFKELKKEVCYRFHIDYSVNTQAGKAYAVIFQTDKNNEELAVDYLEKDEDGGYSLEIELLPETKCLRAELMFYSLGKGKATFKDLEIYTYNKSPHRIVNVATSYFPRKWYPSCKQNISTIMKIIDNAAADKNKPDILCFTETVYSRGIDVPISEKSITEDNEVIKAVKEKAVKYKMYIIFSFVESENGRLYNTSAVISDKGEIIGKTRKNHMCYDEIKEGIMPGRECPVYELPFGKIGILICWDQWFPEAARELVKKGAEIIFLTTAGNPECISRARAYENGVFTVVSGCQDNNHGSSYIVNEHGDIIAQVKEDMDYVCTPIDLDAHKYIEWLSFRRGYGRNLYKLDRRDDIYNFKKRRE